MGLPQNGAGGDYGGEALSKEALEKAIIGTIGSMDQVRVHEGEKREEEEGRGERRGGILPLTAVETFTLKHGNLNT
jgi:hypothetical protein